MQCLGNRDLRVRRSLSGDAGNATIYAESYNTLFDRGLGCERALLAGEIGANIELAAASIEFVQPLEDDDVFQWSQRMGDVIGFNGAGNEHRH